MRSEKVSFSAPCLCFTGSLFTAAVQLPFESPKVWFIASELLSALAVLNLYSEKQVAFNAPALSTVNESDYHIAICKTEIAVRKTFKVTVKLLRRLLATPHEPTTLKKT